MSHDVGAWLEWRDYNFAARGGGDSSRSTSNKQRKGHKGRQKGKSRSRTPDKKGGGKANVAMDQNAEGQDWQGQPEIEGGPT
eukprot:2350536-Alexandrium_andersonii.AAC.1